MKHVSTEARETRETKHRTSRRGCNAPLASAFPEHFFLFVGAPLGLLRLSLRSSLQANESFY